jgi:PBP1b-binding outer membrane lipoprotein LpoB
MERKLLSVATILAACVLLGSCTNLNESAQSVKYATKSEAPKDCTELGEVSVGSLLPLYNLESVKNAMRNKTSEMGGNFLVIDDIKSVANNTGATTGYTGSGRAYQCPSSPTSTN